MNLYRLTALVRTIDLSYGSNRLAVAASLGAGVGTGLISLLAGGQLRLDRIVASAGGVFLAWAIGRELDPDRPQSAAFAIPMAFALALVRAPSLGLGIGALLGTRLMSGTVGRRPTTLDGVVVIAYAAYAGTNPSWWAAIAVIAAALLLELGFTKRAWIVALLMAAASVTSALVASPRISVTITGGEEMLLAVTVLAGAVAVPLVKVSSSCDRGRKMILAWRVSLSWVGAAVVTAGAVLLGEGLVSGSVAAAMWSGAVIIGISSVRDRSAG